MEDIHIKYRFDFGNEQKFSYRIVLDGQSLSLRKPISRNKAKWTALEYNKCSNCPLSAAKHRDCPVALNLVPLIEFSSQLRSYDEVTILVQTQERNIHTKTSTQRALSSLLGLIMATSDCPHMAFFRGLARFHLPFADSQETIFRAVSAYLLAQYLLSKKGGTPDFEIQGLSGIYQNLQTVNRYMAARIKSVTENDATSNAVVLLDLFAKNIPDNVDELLEEVDYLFEAYLRRQINRSKKRAK